MLFRSLACVINSFSSCFVSFRFVSLNTVSPYLEMNAANVAQHKIFRRQNNDKKSRFDVVSKEEIHEIVDVPSE